MNSTLSFVLLATLTLGAACSEPDGETVGTPDGPADAPADQQDAAPGSNVDVDRAATLELGKQVWDTHCTSCHGAEGKGDGPAAAALDPKPTDLTGPRPEERRGEPGGRRKVVEQGLEGTAMVGFKDVLSRDELDAVYQVVHNMRHEADGSGPERMRLRQGQGGPGGGPGKGIGPGGGMGKGKLGAGGPSDGAEAGSAEDAGQEAEGGE